MITAIIQVHGLGTEEASAVRKIIEGNLEMHCLNDSSVMIEVIPSLVKNVFSTLTRYLMVVHNGSADALKLIDNLRGMMKQWRILTAKVELKEL